MQLYLVIGTFPDIDSQLAGYREFINYFEGGCPNDNFDGFELINRVHLPRPAAPMSSSSIWLPGAPSSALRWTSLPPLPMPMWWPTTRSSSLRWKADPGCPTGSRRA